MNRISDLLRYRIIGYFLAFSFGIAIGFVACYYCMHRVIDVKTVILPPAISTSPLVLEHPCFEIGDYPPEMWGEFGPV